MSIQQGSYTIPYTVYTYVSYYFIPPSASSQGPIHKRYFTDDITAQMHP